MNNTSTHEHDWAHHWDGDDEWWECGICHAANTIDTDD